MNQGTTPVYTILHISDLHRNGGEPISNNELLSSLVADFERSAREEHGLTLPDAIFVSGDLVEGLPLGSDVYPAELVSQYEEALALLVALSDEFVNGDRARVILVPGNHDVDWNGVRPAFQIEDMDGLNVSDPRSLTSNPELPYRWCWSQRQLFRIADIELYERRFEYFNRMYSEFYESVSLALPVDPKRPWNLFELGDGRILVSAFNSCVFNDCFSDLGHIRSPDLAECHLEMRRVADRNCLPVAIWHHGIGGPPLASDYIDPSTVKQMIDKGFRLGLHGHRHDSTISPVDLFVSTKEHMAVVGAGSLCSGPTALPQGVNRRYNVIQLDLDNRNGVVHVREMNQPNIWGPGQLFESGGQSHVAFDWTPSSLEVAHQGRSGGPTIARVDEIEHLIESGRYDDAQRRLMADTSVSRTYKRRLLTIALEKAEAWNELRGLLETPENDTELALYFAAAERGGNMDGVAEVLAASETNSNFDHQLIADLKKRLLVRLRLGG